MDQGSASPRYCRLTTSAPPGSKDIASKVNIPFAAIITPFASPENGEFIPPVVDLGESPPRCTRCRGYINANVTWTDSGNKWVCNLCNMSNETPTWYYSSLNGNGLRLDRENRPELSLGSVDFSVGKDYSLRPLQEPIYIFSIDISPRAVNSGWTLAAIKSIDNCIAYIKLYAGDDVRVGIFTFDACIHFYDVRPRSPDPIKILVVDPDDGISALPHNKWILNLSQEGEAIELLIASLPQLAAAAQGISENGFRSSKQYNPRGEMFIQTCPIAAIKSVLHSTEKIGGRLFLFTSYHSNIGFGSMKSRENSALYATDAELLLYAPLDVANTLTKSLEEKAVYSDYITLGNACAKAALTVDIFAQGDSEFFVDYAVFIEICDKTGGTVFPITGNMLPNEMETETEACGRLSQQLTHRVQSISASDVVMKIRTSVGYRVTTEEKELFGAGIFDLTTGEISVAGMDTYSTYCVTLKHDANLIEDEKVHVQIAILYTSTHTKKRLVRVHNVLAFASINPSICFRYTDLDCLAAYYAKTAAEKALHYPLSLNKPSQQSVGSNGGCRQFLGEVIVDILHRYRIHCSPTSPRGQLILPESVKLLPLYISSLMKHPAFIDNNYQSNAIDDKESERSSAPIMGFGKPGQKYVVRGNDRACNIRFFRNMPIRDILHEMYPRMYALHALSGDEGDLVEGGGFEGVGTAGTSNTRVLLPTSLSVTSEVFESDGIYLLVDNFTMWLYIGRNVPQHQLQEWFGLGIGNGAYCNGEERPLHVDFQEGSLAADRMKAIVDSVREHSQRKQEMKVIWSGELRDASSNQFNLRLVEDSIYGAMSYVDYLCKLHGKIQRKL